MQFLTKMSEKDAQMQQLKQDNEKSEKETVP